MISKGRVTALEGQIEEDLKLFKQLFPNKNKTPKQHYGIHILSHIISLGRPIERFISALNLHTIISKELAQKQNFKNFTSLLRKWNVATL